MYIHFVRLYCILTRNMDCDDLSQVWQILHIRAMYIKDFKQMLSQESFIFLSVFSFFNE